MKHCKQTIVQEPAVVDSPPHCPVCSTTITGETHTCTRCNTPHHKDCWEYAKGCAIYGCKVLPKNQTSLSSQFEQLDNATDSWLNSYRYFVRNVLNVAKVLSISLVCLPGFYFFTKIYRNELAFKVLLSTAVVCFFSQFIFYIIYFFAVCRMLPHQRQVRHLLTNNLLKETDTTNNLIAKVALPSDLTMAAGCLEVLGSALNYGLILSILAVPTFEILILHNTPFGPRYVVDLCMVGLYVSFMAVPIFGSLLVARSHLRTFKTIQKEILANSIKALDIEKAIPVTRDPIENEEFLTIGSS